MKLDSDHRRHGRSDQHARSLRYCWSSYYMYGLSRHQLYGHPMLSQLKCHAGLVNLQPHLPHRRSR